MKLKAALGDDLAVDQFTNGKLPCGDLSAYPDPIRRGILT
jgi:hypothetical protein